MLIAYLHSNRSDDQQRDTLNQRLAIDLGQLLKAKISPTSGESQSLCVGFGIGQTTNPFFPISLSFMYVNENGGRHQLAG